MVPVLLGRLHTRLFLLAVVGSAVTALITPLLPLDGPLSVPLPERYRATFVVLAAVAVLGVAWELLYHLLMQFRWEKDWPSLFGLLTAVPEGALLWALLQADAVPLIGGTPTFTAFVVHFGVVWLAVWLVGNGPMRVPFLRWRFQGGRLG